MIFRYKYLNRICLFVCISCLLLTGGLAGCSSFNDFADIVQERKPYDADLLTLKRAERALRNGECEKALEIYRMLSQLARRGKIRRQALYGLACTRLIMANTPEEMDASITLWDAWSELLPESLPYEDPRLMKLILEQKTKMVREAAQKAPASEKKQPEPGPAVSKDMEKDREIERLRGRISELEQKIQTLEHQLESLEAIDQKIQEKKKEIASP